MYTDSISVVSGRAGVLASFSTTNRPAQNAPRGVAVSDRYHEREGVPQNLRVRLFLGNPVVGANLYGRPGRGRTVCMCMRTVRRMGWDEREWESERGRAQGIAPTCP